MLNIEILDASGKVIDLIYADEAFAESVYPGAWRLAEVQPTDSPVAPLPRRISVGAFFDRFGSEKWQILADQSPAVQGVIKDASVRAYIDLENPDLPAGLAIIQAAGHSIDPSEIIDAEIWQNELP